uniref:Putative Glycoprotein endopeptidase n=1 Tax=mine drainage metagenome TaxID=410659 RepID=E6Q834_9ZZZZ
MRLLAIEGALGAFEAAVLEDERVLAQRRIAASQALEAGLAAIAALLEESALAPGDLDRLAVGLGPGGFTGLRVALSYAKALAFAWRLPLVGVSSFDALEAGALQLPRLCIVEGRPGIISARLRSSEGERRASGECAATLAALLPQRLSEPLALAGATAGTTRFFAERGEPVFSLPPVPSPVLALARLALAMPAAASPHALVADYGEAPAAKAPTRA